MKKSIFLPLFFLFVGVFAVGQTSDKGLKLEQAEWLRKNYQFNEAISLYKKVIAQSNDSLLDIQINSLIAESENGLNMLQYATRPTVNAKAVIPSLDFFLYYPNVFNWTALPDSISSHFNKYMSINSAYIREGSTEIFFSAKNGERGWDIFHSRIVDDNLWSNPVPLEGDINSHGDELFPVVSADGKRLYFSSNGHYGMGGFDLYFSQLNERSGEWELPHNMGFPYSSVDNDLLLLHSDDGLYTYFVSDRGVELQDSITLYRLEFEANPIRRAVPSIDEAKELASLRVVAEITQQEEERRTVMTTPQTEEYIKMILEVRKIQRSIDSLSKAIASSRQLYASLTNSDDKLYLEHKITEDELNMINMQSLLRSANEAVQVKEMDFLSKGTLIPRREEFIEEKSNNTTSANSSPLIISAKEYQPFPQINFLPPIELFDYKFRVADESVMAENQEIPAGLVYRIQLFAINSANTDLKAFKGLRPIFESRNSAGRYIYSAGQFYSYQEAVEALNVVKKSGFSSAIITAYNNGNTINIRSARNLESQISDAATYQVKCTGYPAGIPQPVLDLIRENSDRDIAKSIVNGKDVYFIGPYNSQQEANQIVQLLVSIGAEGVSVEEIVKN